MTLSQALALADAGVPETNAARAQVQTAEAHVVGARAALLPSLDVRLSAGLDATEIDVLYGRETLLPGQLVYGFAPTASLDVAATLHLPIWDFGRTRSAVDAAGEGADGARADERAAKSRVFARVASAYLLVLRDAEDVAEGRATVRKREDEANIARRLVANGSRAPSESARAELELNAAQTMLATSEATARQDEMALASALALDPTQRLRLVAPSMRAADMEPEMAAERALKARPELTATRARLRQAEKQLAVERAARRPILSGNAVLHGRYANHVRSDSVSEQAVVLVALSIPVLEPGISARVSAAEGELARAHAELARETLAVRTLAARAAVGCRLARVTLERVETAVALAATILTQVTVRYSNGSASLLELLDAQQADVAARLRVARARYGVGLATVQLLAAIGEVASLQQD